MILAVQRLFNRFPMPRILGIDPGSRATGYGLIDVKGEEIVCVTHGCIRCNEKELSERLLHIHNSLICIITTYAPDEVSIESVFVNRNAQSALVLGHARGVAVLGAACNGLKLAEYAPAQVKSAVVGHGRADKLQVKHMVSLLLKLECVPAADASDALAIAICHARFRGSAIKRRNLSNRPAFDSYRQWKS